MRHTSCDIAVVVIGLLCIQRASGKALAMRIVIRVREELRRRVSQRAENVWWMHGLHVNPDTIEYADMLEEIDSKYMREVRNAAGAERAEHQITNLWDELLLQYCDELEQLANQSEGQKKSILSTCARFGMQRAQNARSIKLLICGMNYCFSIATSSNSWLTKVKDSTEKRRYGIYWQRQK
eukprot:gnl/TRDRNA2_/TRDRNA2_81229_c1_seq1.p1 gnl/TRDRNA2_/TRDRNA2_81229_c1~~gnl/TRDRNA2_/TRDRNA2_81229_c1_seq1.p1  ORF type:complete len:181 (-),score=9.31 gnl/TRDRNA2_/TRDRNA2_81229_c1_seq1:62-604(-)